MLTIVCIMYMRFQSPTFFSRTTNILCVTKHTEWTGTKLLLTDKMNIILKSVYAISFGVCASIDKYYIKFVQIFFPLYSNYPTIL